MSDGEEHQVQRLERVSISTSSQPREAKLTLAIVKFTLGFLSSLTRGPTYSRFLAERIGAPLSGMRSAYVTDPCRMSLCRSGETFLICLVCSLLPFLLSC